ncbi:MAG: hypothetical protein ACRDL7_03710, partial [Gaiellaceae bacterium]
TIDRGQAGIKARTAANENINNEEGLTVANEITNTAVVENGLAFKAAFDKACGEYADQKNNSKLITQKEYRDIVDMLLIFQCTPDNERTSKCTMLRRRMCCRQLWRVNWLFLKGKTGAMLEIVFEIIHNAHKSGGIQGTSIKSNI